MAQSIRRNSVVIDMDHQILRDPNYILRVSPVYGESDAAATLSFIQLSSDEDSTRLSSNTEKGQALKTQFAPWGIHWQNPAFIIAIFFVGLALSLAHHFYYLSLNDQRTGDAKKQAWPTQIGTGLAFLVTSCLKAGTTVALGQYVWTIVKHQSFTMASLDKLFALSTDPMALLSLKLLKSAKIALFLGIVTWFLGAASVAPPATLTVVAKNISQEIHVPVLDFSLPSWNTSEPGVWDSTLVTNTIAANAASNMDVAQLARQVTSSEWSYTVQFFGPSLQCHEPNSTEQVTFDNVTQWFEEQNIFTFTDQNDTRSNTTFSQSSGRLIYTSWSYWFAGGTPNEAQLPKPFALEGSLYPQIWIQTSASSIVCNSVNASFDIMVSFVNGVQHITQQNVQVIGSYDISYLTIDGEEAVFTNTGDGVESVVPVGGTEAVLWSPYISHMYALGGILSGNIILRDTFKDNESGVRQYYGYGATSVLESGLMACDEISNSPFKTKSLDMGYSTETFTNSFPSEPWMCRNRTLMRALEDLANNITISYLSSPDLTNDYITQNVITSNTYNIYLYRPLYLLLSYGLALLFSLIATIIGFYSMHLNGVFHSNSFSAIVATTRNLELGAMSGRSSLGADPMQTDAGGHKLRFGPLLTTANQLKNKVGRNVQVIEEVPHVAFGFEENIGHLKKGELYH